MYLYKVTYLPTREFYYGLSADSVKDYDPTKFTDPGNKFQIYGTNGVTRIANCEKRIIARVGTKKDLIKLGNEYNREAEGRTDYKGLVSPFSVPKKKATTSPSPNKTEAKQSPKLNDKPKKPDKSTSTTSSLSD